MNGHPKISGEDLVKLNRSQCRVLDLLEITRVVRYSEHHILVEGQNTF
mgnify:CR=1 FL=1